MAEEDTITQKISDNQVVHVRQSSQQDMDELFKRSLAKQDKKSGWHEKNLPQSFFKEPHSREASIDEGSFGGVGFGMMKQPQTQAQHVRGNSCPAAMSTLAVPRMPASQHRRTSSLEGILDERSLEAVSLPPGWEQAYTPDGKTYFINHNNRTTSWTDPRKAMLNQMPAPAEVPAAPPAPTDGLGPLPEGWERATTPQGEMYFIDHINKVTSWFDPRLPASMQRPGSRSGSQQQPATSPQMTPLGGMVSPQHVFPMASHQQQQQPQQLSPNPSVAVSPTAAAQLGHQRMPSAEYQRQLQLQRLHAEKEKLRRKEEEIRRQQEVLIRQSHMAGAGDQGLEPFGHDLAPAAAGASGAGVDPFLGGMVGGAAGGAPGLGYHVRQESGDSGLGGMRIPEEYAAGGGPILMDEAMDSQDSATAVAASAVAPAAALKRPVPATALAAARGNGDFLSSMDFNENHEADDLMSTLPEDIGGLEHLDVKMDLTWL